ncbi:hypothetical protein MIR68_003143 [Amoeboaphelidium protococcarum]|nr:hypothetical protein MIR68_003143 [Amoeboaphelidium protococcarum]
MTCKEQSNTCDRSKRTSNDSPFRRAERLYKQRQQPLDMSAVIDLGGVDQSYIDSMEIVKIQLNEPIDADNQTLAQYLNTSPDTIQLEAYQFKSVPGLTIIRNAMNIQFQEQMIEKCLMEQTRHTNMTNLDIHYQMPSDKSIFQLYAEQQMSPDNDTPVEIGVKDLSNTEQVLKTVGYEVSPLKDASPKRPSDLLKRLRWCTMRLRYNWFTKLYEDVDNVNVMEIDHVLQQVSFRLVQLIAPHLRVIRGQIGAELGLAEEKPEVYEQRRLQRQSQGYSSILTAKSSQSNSNCEAAQEPIVHDSWSQDRASRWKAEAGIINYYGVKDSLTAHVDRSEINMESPLISYSFGNACIFLISTDPQCTMNGHQGPLPVAIKLESGDVLFMSAEARRAHHGVPRILEQSFPPDLFASNATPLRCLLREYLQNVRININLRQVFPID